MSDIVYGSCCIDDFTASHLGAHVLIHYGHIPIQETTLCSVLYIFVELKIDTTHFLAAIQQTFKPNLRLSFVSTIQFVSALHNTVKALRDLTYTASVEQSHPLSKGEILGCTSPKLSSQVDALIYLGDGRFHIESSMMQNPDIPAYRYDPYTQKLSRETIDHEKLMSIRRNFIKASLVADATYGVILGTLGHQGSFKVMEYFNNCFKKCGKTKFVNILVSEITPELLIKFGKSIDVYVQIACPRLSIDWGSSFCKPLLTTYEVYPSKIIVDECGFRSS
ncbi:hypothetical protein HZS_27 [Henneguya salminicola]|nr:hypothetical protein HZS_27 [Henneguya salminicola]